MEDAEFGRVRWLFETDLQRIHERLPYLEQQAVVVTLCIGERFEAMCKWVQQNRWEYVSRHGYGLHFVTRMPASKRPFAWLKLPLLAAILTLPNVQQAFWADADAAFMRMDRPLPTPPVQPKRIEAVFSEEVGLGSLGLGQMFPASIAQTGSFWLLATPWSTRLLHEAWNVFPPPEPDRWWEQSSLIYLLGGQRPECRRDIRVSDCYNQTAGYFADRSSVLCAVCPESLAVPIWSYRSGVHFMLHAIAQTTRVREQIMKAARCGDAFSDLQREGSDSANRLIVVQPPGVVTSNLPDSVGCLHANRTEHRPNKQARFKRTREDVRNRLRGLPVPAAWRARTSKEV